MALPPSPGDSDSERFDPSALSDPPPELALSRLPVGRHGLPRSFVVRNQRARLIAAMLRVLPRHGYPATTIGHVTAEAGVSRGAFYQHFEGKEECFLAAYDLAGRWLCERVERAASGERDWAPRVRAGVGEALGLLAANPEVAHLLVVEGMQAGEGARERRRACIGRFAGALRAGRPADPDLPPELEEMLFGGAFHLVATHLEAGRVAELPAATGELVQYLLLPYMESVESKRIAREAA